jgi:hypothetical protein
MIRITGTLHEDQCTVTISRSVLLRMRNVSDKSLRECQNTHFMSNNFLFENHALYGITCKITVESGRPHIACWITKATNTSSEYVLIFVSPL